MVSPWRGLDPLGESERALWSGRDAERDELAQMVLADAFRAGLLFGELGVGKTSLIRAGLLPVLRERGVIAMVCDDLAAPTENFAGAVTAFGFEAQPGEQAVGFLTRVVANAAPGQQFVFIVDDVDVMASDERALGELADMFAKVASRSAGRARFVFVAASERMYALGALERRTGSLFPPSNRFELARFAPTVAVAVLERALVQCSWTVDADVVEAVVQGIAQPRGVLAADVQVCAMALRELEISSLAELQALGGAMELEAAWLRASCAATGDERSALRLCAELAVGQRAVKVGDQLARDIGVDIAFANRAFVELETHGVVARCDGEATTWRLRHEVLAPRLREVAAPARASARRAFDLLGSKTAHQQRLTLSELYALHREGIAPVTTAEAEVVQRSTHYYKVIAGAVAGGALLLLIAILISLRGRVFFDLRPAAGGDRVVVRSGRTGLAAFRWLPGAGYGRVIADTGLTRAMVAPTVWTQIEHRDLGATKADWTKSLKTVMSPLVSGLIEYATTGSDAALAELYKSAKEQEDLAELLFALAPIARGTPAEVQIVETAIATPNLAVQRAAMATAGSAAQRHDGHRDMLIRALTASDPELRRLAFSTVRGLGARSGALFAAALAQATEPAARRELAAEVAQSNADARPSAATAAAALADSEAPVSVAEKARAQLKAALALDPTRTVEVLVGLVAQDRASPEARVFAAQLLRDLEPPPNAPNMVEAARTAFASKAVAVRAAALPLYAKLDPERAGGELATMLDDKKLDKPLRIAAALAWGEVATANRGAAEKAIGDLLQENDPEIRAAAATAAGKLGRAYQDRLVKMAKNESYTVRLGAAEGLALTALSGGSVGVGIDGIAQLWREKGRPRRDAAKIWGRLARKKPFPQVVSYLTSAVVITEDPALHPLGVEGLCNAALAGADVRPGLRRAADDPSLEVRRMAMSCIANGPDPVKNGAVVAAKLIKDPDSEIRTDAARVLALPAGQAKRSGTPPETFVALLDDPDREVRSVAILAVGALGRDAPKPAAPAMAKLFHRGDDTEKLALVRAARLTGDADLIGFAVADRSPAVRTAAVEAGLASGVRASATLSASLADVDRQVRKATLELLGLGKYNIDALTLDRALSLAVRDPDPELRQLALTTLARIAPVDAVNVRLVRALASRHEQDRAQAAAAAIGLAERDAARAVALLEPMLSDPSRDVRVALLPSLAAAYAKVHPAKKLAELIAGSETHAMRRLAAAAAFATVATADAASTETTLKTLKPIDEPMARQMALLIAGLVASKSDAVAFLQELVP